MSISEIENLLRHILLTKFKVILPGVGTIILKAENPKSDVDKKSISAPVLKIIFSDKNPEENQDLSTDFRKHFNISEDEAIHQLRIYSEKIFSGLNEDKQYEISGIGNLLLDKGEKLYFTPNQSMIDLVNCNSEESVPIYHYPSIEKTEEIKPIPLSKPEEFSTETGIFLSEEPKSKFYQNKKVLISFIAFFCVIITLFFIKPGWLINLWGNSDVTNLNKDNLLVFSDSTVWDQIRLTPSLKEDSIKIIPSSIKDTLTQPSKVDYFVIIASFENLANAENYALDMNKKGINTSMFAPFGGGNLYRISAGNFTSKDEAIIKSDELKNHHNLQSWILFLSLTNNK